MSARFILDTMGFDALADGPLLYCEVFAHAWLRAEDNLMRLTGRQSRTMLSRYATSEATERALAAHRRLGPRDRP